MNFLTPNLFHWRRSCEMCRRPGYYLAAPAFDDGEKTRLARLLNATLLAFAVLDLADMLLLLIFAPATIPTFWINGVGLLGCFALIYVMRRGGVRLAAWLLCLMIYVLIVYYTAISGGLRSPAFSFILS